MLEVHVVYNKHTATATTITRHEFTMQVPAAHTTLVRDSKQAMATTSTLLRYTIVVAPDAASQGPSSVTLQVANSLPTPGRERKKSGKNRILIPATTTAAQPNAQVTIRGLTITVTGAPTSTWWSKCIARTSSLF